MQFTRNKLVLKIMLCYNKLSKISC